MKRYIKKSIAFRQKTSYLIAAVCLAIFLLVDGGTKMRTTVMTISLIGVVFFTIIPTQWRAIWRLFHPKKTVVKQSDWSESTEFYPDHGL